MDKINAHNNLIPQIRAASRHLVRELGFMNRTLAGTRLTASGVHALVEIRAAGELSAKALAGKLLLEKSTVSRLLAGLIQQGELRETRSKVDAREKSLRLSAKGKQTLKVINRYAQHQVHAAIEGLPSRIRREILSGLDHYARALERSRTCTSGGLAVANTVITNGYTPGLVGRVVEMHASYYSKALDFGASFETTVASGLADFIARVDTPDNAIWSLSTHGEITGSIAIDGEDLTDGIAHLRWFIVDDCLRGSGMGKQLLQTALDFCEERGFAQTHLWTIEGLDAARHLYEQHGFSLAETYTGTQCGTACREQRFVRVSAS